MPGDPQDPSAPDRNVKSGPGIPFPSLDAIVVQSSSHAETTTSPIGSQLTSSDKLLALPTPISHPNASRPRRSPLSLARVMPNPTYRHSLDALPSFKSADIESIQSLTWKPHRAGFLARATASDGSIDREAPKRVSFEGGRDTPNLRHAFPPSPPSDSPLPSPAVYAPSQSDSPRKAVAEPPSRSLSRPRSRAASPLRIIHNWAHGHARPRNRNIPDEPFVPVDPFRFKTHFRLSFLSPRSSIHTFNTLESPDGDVCVPPSELVWTWKQTRLFLGDTLPRQVYLNFLLRLPAMYFTRVARIFEDAEVSRPDIQRMIESGGGGSAFISQHSRLEDVPLARVESNNQSQGRIQYPPLPTGHIPPSLSAGVGLSGQVGAAPAGTTTTQMPPPLPLPDEWSPPLVSPALVRFKLSWETFIDSLMREWKTLNVVSALLLSAILSTFQVPALAADPVVRTPALISLICALMSLSYGCMYIVRFGTMRSMFRASRWAEEARKTHTSIWWNVWVLLSMPVVWMAWSMIAFVTSILAFVWRSGSTADPANPEPLGPKGALADRIVITAVFVLGLLYFVLIVRTLRAYGVGPERPSPAGVNANVGAVSGARVGGRESQTPRMRGGDIELELAMAMERRGRERERTMSGSVGVRREGARTVDVVGKRRSVGRDEDGGGKEPDGGGHGWRGMLGLGLVGLHDLEKGHAERSGADT